MGYVLRTFKVYRRNDGQEGWGQYDAAQGSDVINIELDNGEVAALQRGQLEAIYGCNFIELKDADNEKRIIDSFNRV